MVRLLPIFLALVTLSACQREAPGPDARTGAETPSASAEASGTTTVPRELQWHYVGVPVCLIEGNPAPGGGGKALVSELVKLPDSTLIEVLAPTQVGDPDGGLLDFIRENWSSSLKGDYALDDWPASLELQLRDSTGARLDPGALVLPWPFPADADGTLQKRLEAARETAGLPPIPSLGSTSASSVLLEPIMAAGEATVMDPTTRATFEQNAKGRGCGIERNWLANQAGPAYPRNFTACADDDLLTTETQWEWSGANPDSLHFRLGWTQAVTILYHRWPCGAFSGYD